MNKREDGGPAFPHDARDMGKSPSNGMTLRDYFAGQALSAQLGNGTITPHMQSLVNESGLGAHIIYARMSYAYADAMLAERSK